MLKSRTRRKAERAAADGAIITIRDLHKAYRTPAGDFPALRGVDLRVNRGDFMAVVGKSGAGKSTLINCVTGIDSPDSGEIHVDGSAVHTMGEDARSRWRGENLGVVFQFFQLLPNLTLIENITIAMDFRNSYPLRERKERALHLLEQVDIAEHAYKTPGRISGGQQQRVAIARALANDPPVLVADEPTGNLDSKTAGAIFDLFEDLVYNQGKTLLMVTHDRDIQRRASRVVEMADGRIEA
ncbi:MAG: ABC transporter ATP-binding protein [Chloroflexi bacterium]|nr:ABC transporter ATP-binding protein [Chloroflexota bacterium]